MVYCSRGESLQCQMLRCIENNRIEEFDRSLRQGMDINIELYGTSPMHVVCMYGHENFLKYLIDHKGDLNIPDYNQKTPIMMCIQYNQWECFNILISRGALYGMEIKKWLKRRENNAEVKEVVSELISQLLWKRRSGLVYYYSLGKINLPSTIFRDMVRFL